MFLFFNYQAVTLLKKDITNDKFKIRMIKVYFLNSLLPKKLK